MMISMPGTIRNMILDHRDYNRERSEDCEGCYMDDDACPLSGDHRLFPGGTNSGYTTILSLFKDMARIQEAINTGNDEDALGMLKQTLQVAQFILIGKDAEESVKYLEKLEKNLVDWYTYREEEEEEDDA